MKSFFNIKSIKSLSRYQYNLQLNQSFFKQSKNFFSKTNPTNPELVSYEMNNQIGILTIKNSAKRNALSINVMESLWSKLDIIESTSNSEKPKVVILASEGTVFSAGHDLKEILSLDEKKQQYTFELCGEIMIKLQQLPQIVIAEIQGLATAAGLQLACTCDLTVASHKSSYSTPGIKVGLFCTTPSVALSRVISQKRAMYMLTTGETINAKTAEEWGIINEIIDVGEDKDKEREKLRECSLKLANQITRYSGYSESHGKKAFYTQTKIQDLNEAYCYASKIMKENLEFEDTKEGMNAFAQKRHPKFKH